jgi:hypothetical protein
VRGDVIVEPGGSLRTREATTTEITGNVEGENAAYVVLLGRALVGGSLRLTGTREVINVGTPGGRTLGVGSVKGNVEIDRGASEATLFHETVGGNVHMLNNSTEPARASEGAPAEVEVLNSTVGGNVELSNNTLANSILDSLAVARSSVAGNVVMFNNTETQSGESGLVFEAFVTLRANHVGGSAELLNNINNTGTRRPEVSDNVVTNILNCAGNIPAPFGNANTAKQKLGQCALL